MPLLCSSEQDLSQRSAAVPTNLNASIIDHFQSLEDPRINRTKKNYVLDILVIAVCTLLTGGEGFQDLALKSGHILYATSRQGRRLDASLEVGDHQTPRRR